MNFQSKATTLPCASIDILNNASIPNSRQATWLQLNNKKKSAKRLSCYRIAGQADGAHMSLFLVSEDYSVLVFIFVLHASPAQEHANKYVMFLSRIWCKSHVMILRSNFWRWDLYTQSIKILHMCLESLYLNIWHKRS